MPLICSLTTCAGIAGFPVLWIWKSCIRWTQQGKIPNVLLPMEGLWHLHKGDLTCHLTPQKQTSFLLLISKATSKSVSCLLFWGFSWVGVRQGSVGVGRVDSGSERNSGAEEIWSYLPHTFEAYDHMITALHNDSYIYLLQGILRCWRKESRSAAFIVKQC